MTSKVWHGLGQSVTDAMDEWHKHLWASTRAKGGCGQVLVAQTSLGKYSWHKHLWASTRAKGGF